MRAVDRRPVQPHLGRTFGGKSRANACGRQDENVSLDSEGCALSHFVAIGCGSGFAVGPFCVKALKVGFGSGRQPSQKIMFVALTAGRYRMYFCICVLMFIFWVFSGRQSQRAMDEKIRCATLHKLREEIGRVTQASAAERPVFSSGLPALDVALPEGGFRGGALVEWVIEGEGIGGEAPVLLAVQRAASGGGLIVAVDRRRQFYPPAAVRWGIDPRRLIIVSPETQADELWALDQSLRSPAVRAVLAWLDRLDGRTYRRLQLAAEQGGALGLLIRSAGALRQASWAEVRLLVRAVARADGGSPQQEVGGRAEAEDKPLPLPPARRLRVAVLRTRHRLCGQEIEIEVDDEAGSLRVVSAMGDSTVANCREGTRR